MSDSNEQTYSCVVSKELIQKMPGFVAMVRKSLGQNHPMDGVFIQSFDAMQNVPYEEAWRINAACKKFRLPLPEWTPALTDTENKRSTPSSKNTEEDAK